MTGRKIGRKITGIFLMILTAIALISPANALVCVTMSNGSEWNDAKIKVDEAAYFTFRVYNSSADGRLCEDGTYEINVELIDSDYKIDEIFNWSIDSPSFDMKNGENKQVLLTLTPKELGAHTIKVTTKLIPKGSGGTQMVYTTSAKINAAVSLEGDKSFNEIPFWKVRKDCPNGLVVKEGEECPKLCENGAKAYESKGEECPEDSEKNNTVFLGAGNSETIFWGGLGGAIATIAILALVAYKRKQEAQMIDGTYNVEQ